MNSETYCDDELKGIYDFLSRISRKAYKDIFLLSNQVLSKNPCSNNFLKRFLCREEIVYPSVYRMIFKLLKYYFGSAKKYFEYILEFILYFLSPFKFSFSEKCSELILINTFFIVRTIKESNIYNDFYFPGLRNVLERLNKHYAYLPMFGGARTITEFRDTLRILKKENIPILSEYQLLSVSDLLYLFYFILIYPFHVFRFLNTIRGDTYEEKLLKSELLNTLDLFTFNCYARYLLGKEIAKLPYRSIKVISWYENQVIDKNLYNGLREVNSKVKIYGAQLFLYSRAEINIIPDENEEIFGVIPDKIIVNGPIFLPRKTRLNYAIGPSLRNEKIFDFTTYGKNKEKILVLLPYHKTGIKNVLKMISFLKVFLGQMHIKIHPAVTIEEIKDLLPEECVVANSDIYELFKTTKIIIGAASGTLIEAATLGIPSVIIKNNGKLDFNPFLDYGKGIIWEEASTPEEVTRLINKFNSELDNNFEKIITVANEYKKMFFCRPSEENIIKAFDL